MRHFGAPCFAGRLHRAPQDLARVLAAASAPQAKSAPAESRLRPAATACRVLIVEDEAIVAMALEAYVEDFGFEACGIAATGLDAVELAKTQRPDVVLMDISLMGDMDGVEAARRAREDAGVRVVFVTAYGSGEVMERIRSLHPDAPVVPKPVDPPTLRRAIEQAGGR